MTANDTGSKAGKIGWIDLTVPDADAVRDFYKAVVGWEAHGCDMGGYEDYNMQPPGAAQPVAGVCHARGVNADLPAQWIIYITVEDLDASMEQVRINGGEVIAGPKGEQGKDRYCIIRDPAGAVAALYQAAAV